MIVTSFHFKTRGVGVPARERPIRAYRGGELGARSAMTVAAAFVRPRFIEVLDRWSLNFERATVSIKRT